jgi:hypothetical protein
MSSTTPEPKSEDDAQRIKRFLQGGGQLEINVVETVKSRAGAQSTFERPGTVTFPATIDHVVSAIGTGLSRRATILLEFAGVAASDQFSAAVFINKLDASLQTSFEDPAFAGAVGFFVHSPDPGGSMAGMADTLVYELDVTNLFKRIQRASSALTATVVLHPPGKLSSTSNTLALQSATLKILDSTVKRSS